MTYTEGPVVLELEQDFEYSGQEYVQRTGNMPAAIGMDSIYTYNCLIAWEEKSPIRTTFNSSQKKLLCFQVYSTVRIRSWLLSCSSSCACCFSRRKKNLKDSLTEKIDTYPQTAV